MKILILGARGMLGMDLLSVLSGKHEVCGRDLQDFDITVSGKTREEIEAIHPDVVINCAAYTDVDGSESKKDLAFSVNGDGTRNVALGCAVTGAKMIHISTDYIFDGKSPVPYPEEAQPNPLNVYGDSKLRGEYNIQEVFGNYLIIRSAWLYGQHGKNFVNTIRLLASHQDELRVVNDQRGSPTFTKDLSWAIVQLLKVEYKGILHITNSGFCTWFDFARKILEIKPVLHRRIKVIPITSNELARPAPRPSNSVLDCSRFEKVTGCAMRTWEEALKDYLSGVP
jgi:dTDP-4-dehydrorhamnose reductase